MWVNILDLEFQFEIKNYAEQDRSRKRINRQFINLLFKNEYPVRK